MTKTNQTGGPSTDRHRQYWRQNLRYLGVLLSIWAFVSFGCGIVFADWLNQYQLPGTGFPLGFWFAQQGSIYVFVVLILIYVLLMNRLDRKYDFDEK
ncbi:MAG: putative solute:sodium symporter small subunit [Candidatus Paceibacteria bacterium]|jgi:putative solute:sodium symporter small subunit